MNVFILDERFTYSTGEEKVVPSYKVSVSGLKKLKEKGISYTTNPKEADKWAFKELYDGSPLMIKKKHISATKIKAEDIENFIEDEEKNEIDKKNSFKDSLAITEKETNNSEALDTFSKEESISDLENKDDEKDR